MSLIDLYIKDKHSGKIHRIGSDQHDMLTIVNGTLRYQNLQNGDGCTLGMNAGGYEFVDNADEEGYNRDPRTVCATECKDYGRRVLGELPYECCQRHGVDPKLVKD